MTGASTASVIIGMGPPSEIAVPERELIHVGLYLHSGHSGGPLVGINTMMAGLHACRPGRLGAYGQGVLAPGDFVSCATIFDKPAACSPMKDFARRLEIAGSLYRCLYLVI